MTTTNSDAKNFDRNKIKLIKNTLFDAKYSTEYESGAEYFLNSVGEQVKKKGELTLKQKESLNKMYNRFKKRGPKFESPYSLVYCN